MNKYKFVSFVLLIALLAVGTRLFMALSSASEATDKRCAVIENILSRKSVRSYTDEPVAREMLDSLVRMAMAAPTGKDMRPWQFVVIDEPAVLDTLRRRLPRMQPLKGAAAAILVCGDTTVVDREGRPSSMWMLDCSAATENALLAAEAMGLGAVWLGVYPFDDRMPVVAECLRLPAGVKPLSLIAVGHPNGPSQPKDKYDTTRIHYNGW